MPLTQTHVHPRSLQAQLPEGFQPRLLPALSSVSQVDAGVALGLPLTKGTCGGGSRSGNKASGPQQQRDVCSEGAFSRPCLGTKWHVCFRQDSSGWRTASRCGRVARQGAGLYCPQLLGEALTLTREGAALKPHSRQVLLLVPRERWGLGWGHRRLLPTVLEAPGAWAGPPCLPAPPAGSSPKETLRRAFGSPRASCWF